MRVAETTTIPKLAKASGVNQRTLFRRLMALHARDGGDWLYRGKRKILINVEALRAAHPSLFEPVDLAGRLDDQEEAIADLEHETAAQRRALGHVVQRLERVESALMLRRPA